jgi:bacterioferritin
LTSQKLKDLLNAAIAREVQVSVQYMWQHVQWMGVDHYAVSDKFRDIAVEEMKHAEKIAERLWYLGGVPTTKPAPINVGGELWEMVDNDIKAELEAITLYRSGSDHEVHLRGDPRAGRGPPRFLHIPEREGQEEVKPSVANVALHRAT